MTQLHVMILLEKLSWTKYVLGEGQCPEIVEDSPLSVAYSHRHLKLNKWFDLSYTFKD